MNWDLTAIETWEEASAVLTHRRFAVVLYDRDLPGRDWRQTIAELARISPCILLASPVIDDALWQEVVERGGYDVLTKPFDEEHVLFAIDQGLWYSATTAHAAVTK
jgi:DNA-binding response OmpR family regulator